MDWKGLAIGMGNAVGTAVPQMERMDLAEQEMGIRTDTHKIAMEKNQEEKVIRKGLEAIAFKHLQQGKTLAPQGGAIGNRAPQVDEAAFQQWYKDVATKQGLDLNPDNPLHKYDYRSAYASGATPDASGHWPSEFKADDHPNRFVGGVDTKTGQVAFNEATVSGAPNVDTGSAIEIGQNPSKAASSSAGPPAVNNELATRSIRGNMLMEMHDFLMGKGRIAEAKQLRKAELDNIINIAKISPKGALKSWNNTSWLVEEYGPLNPGDIKTEGKSHVLTFGPNHDGIIQWDDTGNIKVVQKPGSQGKTPTPQMYVEKPIGANSQQKFQYNEKTGQHDIPFGEPYRIHKPDKEGKDSDDERKEFNREAARLDSLYGRLANIKKGIDSLGNIIPQDKVDEAMADIQEQINSKEELMKADYPDRWKMYRKPKESKGAVGGGGPGRQANVAYLKTYIKENSEKSSAKQIFETLTKAGYSKEAILSAIQELKTSK